MYKNPTSQVKQLVEYIKKNLAKGYNIDTLRFSLQGQGYSRLSISEAIEIATKELAKDVPPMKEKPLIIHRIMESDEEPKKKGFWKRLFGLD